VVNKVELLVVNPNNPANNLAQFVANAMTKSANMASSGMGGVPNLAAVRLADTTGAKLLHVPYKGAAPAINDVMAGHVDGFGVTSQASLTTSKPASSSPLAWQPDNVILFCQTS